MLSRWAPDVESKSEGLDSKHGRGENEGMRIRAKESNEHKGLSSA
jgi:hypothetical protein